MSWKLPLGTNLSDLLSQGRTFAQGLPSTVESGLKYLGDNALNPQEPMGRALGQGYANTFLTPPGANAVGKMADVAGNVMGRIGVGVKDVPGSPIPDVSFGRQPTIGTRGMPPRKGPPPTGAGSGNLGMAPPPSQEMPYNGQPSGIAPGLSSETQTTLGDAARLGYLTSPQPGYYKVDRLGESPFYTNQQEALYDVLRKEADKRRDYNTATKDPGLDSLMGGGMATSISGPEQPSPSPAEGAEGTEVKGKAFDWSTLNPVFDKLGEIGHAMTRPGSDRPYAQMGWDEQEQENQQREDMFRKEKIAQEQMEAENALKQQEIGSRFDIAQMGEQGAMERVQEQGRLHLEAIQAEINAKGDPNAPISDALAAALGAPPGTPLREAAMFSKAKSDQIEAQQSQAYQSYLQTQSSNLGADNRRQAIQSKMDAIKSNPIYFMSPQGQQEYQFWQSQMGVGEGLPTPPAYQPPAQPPQAPQQPGLWDKIKGAGSNMMDYFSSGGQSDPNAPLPKAQAQGPGAQPAQPAQALGGQPQGPGAPPQPNPVPLEVFRATSKLPGEGATIVQQIFAQHGSDPATLKYKLQEFVRGAPPEYRQVVMEAIAPLIARM